MCNAIYYRDNYLLLPDDFPDHDAFMTALRSRALPATFRLIPLWEDNRIRSSEASRGMCMAPFFLQGYRDEPVTVAIDGPDAVYPVQVERLTQEAYDRRLREVVCRCCPGCKGYTPITGDERTLMGHHAEISLNGVCFFRRESRSLPCCFGLDLRTLGAVLGQTHLAGLREWEICDEIRAYTGLSCSYSHRTIAGDGAMVMTFVPKKPALLSPLLTLAAGRYLSFVTDGTFRLDPHPLPDLHPDALMALAAPERLTSLRRDCRKFGAALAEMTWDGRDEGRIAASMTLPERRARLSVLHAEAGRAVLLLLDAPEALKELRYRSPMLAAHGTTLTVHDQYHSRRYTVNFDMPSEILA